jgi:predicted alpha/beta superfamily hydrolase
MGRLICCLLFFASQLLQHCTEGNPKQVLTSASTPTGLFTKTIYSAIVKDSFGVTVLKPPSFNSQEKYHHVYITDGSLGIGAYVLGQVESWKATIPSNCIIIAISHTGYWETKRARDFIPSDITGNSKSDFGDAENFYLFLKDELIPQIDKEFPNKKDRSFIGHSFGGLFCLYTLFKDDKLFDKHFAISPSIWANNYELNKIEENFSINHKSLNADVILFAGGLEFLNKVLPATRNFYNTIEKRNYSGLQIKKQEINNANHFSIRKP